MIGNGLVKSILEVRLFCKKNRNVSICDSLENLISLYEKSEKDSQREESFEDYYRIELAQSVTHSNLVNLSLFSVKILIAL